MNAQEGARILSDARMALRKARCAERVASRKRRLRSLELCVEAELEVLSQRALADPAGTYEPLAANFLLAARDLVWLRKHAGNFGLSGHETGLIIAATTMILEQMCN